MRVWAAMAIAGTLLAACGQPEAPPPPPPAAEAPAPAPAVAEAVMPDTVVIPTPVAAGTDILTGIAEGGSATIKLDACPKANFNAAEKLGTLTCGQSYAVFYEGATGRWVSVGPNAALLAAKAKDPRGAGKNPGPDPSQRMLVVWGLGLKVGDDYKLSLADGTVVGRLVHTPT